MEKSFLQIAMLVALAVVTVSCDDQAPTDNARGRSAALPVKDIGLNPDTFGEVRVQHDITLSNDTIYILHNYYHIGTGHTITIEPGTIIKGVKLNTTSADIAAGTLIIDRGAKIHAVGTPNNPIVFTSNENTPVAGDWGGIIVLGKADVNICANCGVNFSGIDRLGVIAGYHGTNVFALGRYGNGDNPAVPPSGSYNADNSGEFQYVRIEHAGDNIGPFLQTPALTLAGVGSNTTIDHVETYNCFGDGFAINGGTVNAKHLISYKITDDDIDMDLGYRGNIQFIVIIRDPNVVIAGGGGDGIESNGDTDLDVSTGSLLTNATLANITILGPINSSITSVRSAFNDAVVIRKGSELNIFNSIIIGFRNYQIELTSQNDFDSDGNNSTDNKVSIEGVTIVGRNYASVSTQTTNIPNFTTLSAYNNENFIAKSQSDFIDFPSLTAAAWESPRSLAVINGLELPSVTLNILLNSFFTPVDFRGAFGDANEAANAAWGINNSANNWVIW